MDSFGSTRYLSRILPRFQFKRAAGRLLQASDPIPQGSEILIIKRELPNVLIKFDGFLEPVPCLHYPAAHAGVSGEGESDSGNLGMYRLRSHQNGFRFLYTLDLPH
jgi:hypothetical protein